MAHEAEVVEITSDNEVDDEVEPPVLLWELAVVLVKGWALQRARGD